MIIKIVDTDFYFESSVLRSSAELRENGITKWHYPCPFFARPPEAQRKRPFVHGGAGKDRRGCSLGNLH